MSLGLRFRRRPELPLGPAPWPLSAEAEALVGRSAGTPMAPLLEGYTGIDFRRNQWSQGADEDAARANRPGSKM